MLAVRYCGASKPFALQTVPLPTHLPGHVLVQIKASALCHTELHFMDGTLNFGVNNITMGHETVGIITAVGDGVESSRVGERVIVYYYIGCQQCKHCKKGNQQLCGSMKGQHGFLSDGGLAEYILTPSRNAIVLPESLSFESAAPIGCGVTTAVHACKLAKPEADEWVAIFGVNGVGFSIIQLAKHFKCKVIAISRSVDKLSKATELGADAVVDATDSSTVANKIREITGGEGADIIFECVGDRTTMDQCVGWGGALAKRGRLVFIGYKAGNEHEFRVHPIPLLVYEQHILGSVGATLEDLKEAVEYVGNGIISTVVDSCISIQDFQLAYNRMLT
eukprot:gene8309-17099_t